MTLLEMLRQRSPSVGRVKSAYITRAGSSGPFRLRPELLYDADALDTSGLYRSVVSSTMSVVFAPSVWIVFTVICITVIVNCQ